MMERRFRSQILAVCGAAALAVAWPGSAAALTDEEIFREFRFSFANPGARALGMGGAAVAVANDSTAARANPAGLHFVREPEILVEFNTIEADDEVFRSNLGSLTVDPITGARDLPFLGLTSSARTDQENSLGYFGFAHPLLLGPNGPRLTIAGSRQVSLSQDRILPSSGDVTSARFSFDFYPNTVSGGALEAYSVNTPVTGGSSTEIINWNVGASLEVHPDFSLGLNLTYATLDMQVDTLTRVEDPDQLTVSDPSHPRLPATPMSDLFESHIDDGDSDLTYTIGIHWHPDSLFALHYSPWQFGAVFRKGAEFAVVETTVLNEVPDESFSNTVIIPDQFGLGVSYRTKRHWLLTADLERIEFTDLLEGFRSGVNYLTSGRVAGGAFPVDPARSVEFTVDDGNVYRFGVEYVHPLGGMHENLIPLTLQQRPRVSLWAGYFRTPDSRIRMSGFNSTDPDVNAVYLDAFRGGEEESHVTAGIGLYLERSAFRFAAETSDAGHQLIGSYIYMFGKGLGP